MNSSGKLDFDIYDDNLLTRVMNTWKLRGIKPKCHWSNQAPSSRKGTHSDCVETLEPVISVCRRHGCDIMLEAKDKDVCALRMLEKHYRKNIIDSRIAWTLD